MPFQEGALSAEETEIETNCCVRTGWSETKINFLGAILCVLLTLLLVEIAKCACIMFGVKFFINWFNNININPSS